MAEIGRLGVWMKADTTALQKRIEEAKKRVEAFAENGEEPLIGSLRHLFTEADLKAMQDGCTFKELTPEQCQALQEEWQHLHNEAKTRWEEQR